MDDEQKEHEGMYYDGWLKEWVPIETDKDQANNGAKVVGSAEKAPWVTRQEKFIQDRQKVYGENTMSHGSMVLPKEYIRFLWACNITPRQYSILLALMMANSFENEIGHKPVYISQVELGAQLGLTQPAIYQIYKQLEDKEFICPLCKKFELKGYIKREKVPFKNGELQADHVWTDGFKLIINHLAGHYNEYVAEFGYDALEKYKQDRDIIIAGRVPEWRKQLGLRQQKGDF